MVSTNQGYGSDVGYNSFLYSSENDARAILMWLVERLPKEATALTAEILGVYQKLGICSVACEPLRHSDQWYSPCCQLLLLCSINAHIPLDACIHQAHNILSVIHTNTFLTLVMDVLVQLTDAKALLAREFAKEVQLRQQSVWTPSYCKSEGIAWRGEKSANWQLEGAAALVRFSATRTVLPEGLDASLPAERKRYYSDHLPLVTNQPPVRRDVVASVLGTAAAEHAAQLEWEREWNTKGAKSGLSEKECVLPCPDAMCISFHFIYRIAASGRRMCYMVVLVLCLQR